MVLIDNILALPVRGLLRAFREVQDAARREREHEAEAIRAQLSDLYRLLETGKIDESAFAQAETALLDRLDRIEADDSGRQEEGDSSSEEVKP